MYVHFAAQRTSLPPLFFHQMPEADVRLEKSQIVRDWSNLQRVALARPLFTKVDFVKRANQLIEWVTKNQVWVVQ